MSGSRKQSSDIGRFKKSQTDERFLQQLNQAVQPLEAELAEDAVETQPCLYVCGTPRSGTTVLTQAIATHLNVQPINNLIARFWQAPSVGLRLSRMLLSDQLQSAYRSNYGQTQAIDEPHEFGYFWSDLLGYEAMQEPSPEDIDALDWNRVQRRLAAMQAASGRPLVFKAFMTAFYAHRLVELLPKSLFLRMRRDELETCLSVYRGRLDYAGGESAWYSIRPRQCLDVEAQPPAVQVAMQVRYTNLALDRIFKSLPEQNVLSLDYAEFCASPQTALSRIADAMQRLGAVQSHVVGEPPVAFSSPPVRLDEGVRQALAAALDAIGGHGDD